jgi:hypothetical protein
VASRAIGGDERPRDTNRIRMSWTFIALCGPQPARRGHPSLVALLAARDQRRAETGYAASAFFEEDDDFSDFFDEDSDGVEDSFFEDSVLSAPSFAERSISRLRRFVP